MTVSTAALAKPKRSEEEKRLRQEAGTPPDIFALLHERYQFTVDGMAVAHNAKLPRHWTPEDDFFEKSLDRERVFVNPPFSNIRPVLQRVVTEMSVASTGSIVAAWLPASPYGGQTHRPRAPHLVKTSWWDLVHGWSHHLITFDQRPQHIEPPGIKFSSPGAGVMVAVFMAPGASRGRGAGAALPTYLWRLPNAE